MLRKVQRTAIFVALCVAQGSEIKEVFEVPRTVTGITGAKQVHF